jgi:hypothetical protein
VELEPLEAKESEEWLERWQNLGNLERMASQAYPVKLVGQDSMVNLDAMAKITRDRVNLEMMD